MFLKKCFIYFGAVIFHFIPRNNHLWLTGKPSEWYEDFTPPKFFDNSKYFFLYLHMYTNEKVYWISSSEEEIKLLRSMNLPVIKYKSLKGIYLVLRAKYFFHHYGIKQINPVLQMGAVHLDFWHGTPLKKIRYDVVPKDNKKRNFLVRFLDKKTIEYVSSTSEKLSKDILTRAFAVPMDQMLNFGYPRTDILKLNKKETYDFVKVYSPELIPYLDECNKFKKVLLYMPTWRDDNPNYFSDAKIDFEKLNDTLKQLNYVLFLKLHPLTKNASVDGYTNIIQINNDVDIYPFLNYTDFLITDYSSIYFDYLLLDKEIVFIPYDYENYIKNRELYFSYDTVTPGIKYNSFSDFILGLKDIENINFSAERKKVKELFIANYNFDACEKIYNYFAKKGKIM